MRYPSDADLIDASQAAYGEASIESANCHALIREIGGVAIVAFRGTDPRRLIDILQDLHAGVTRDPLLGDLHAGFLEDVASVAWRLIPRLQGLPVAVTGHSKGGAEALVFSAMLAALARPPVRVSTFGAARTGRGSFLPLVAPLAGCDYRYGSDPVPFAPPYFGTPRPLVQIGHPGDRIGVLEDHALSAYQSALPVA